MDVAKLSPTSALKGRDFWEFKAYKGRCAGHDGNLNSPLSEDVH